MTASAIRVIASSAIGQSWPMAGGHVVAEHGDAAAARAEQAGDDTQQSGLAGAVRPHQPGDRPLRHASRDAGQREGAGSAVSVADVVQLDRVHGGGSRTVIGMPCRKASSGFSTRTRRR